MIVKFRKEFARRAVILEYLNGWVINHGFDYLFNDGVIRAGTDFEESSPYFDTLEAGEQFFNEWRKQ